MEIKQENNRLLIIKNGREKIILASVQLSKEEAFLLFSIEKHKRDAVLEIILKAYQAGCEDGQMFGKSPCLTM